MGSDGSTNTTARLRDEIDSGKAGDKNGFPDPAAAPLGTDAEAGGASPTPDEIATARALETGRAAEAFQSSVSARPVAMAPQDRRTGRGGWIAVLVLALCVAVALVVWLG